MSPWITIDEWPSKNSDANLHWRTIETPELEKKLDWMTRMKAGRPVEFEREHYMRFKTFYFCVLRLES